MKLKRLFAFALASALALGTFGLMGCAPAGEEAADTPAEEAPAVTGSVTVEGSDTMLPLSQAWAEAFMDENPGVDITVSGGGSGTGIASLVNGTIDLANSSRSMDEEEVALAAENNVETQEWEVAYDGIAIIVHPSLGVEDLSFADLGAIYRGEITNWSEVGGPDLDIVLVGRDIASGTHLFFLDYVLQAEIDDAVYAPGTRMLTSTTAIVNEVMGNEAAIGYVGLAYLVPEVSVVTVDGVEPSTDTVLDGSYGVARPLYMYGGAELNDAAQAFIDWILSAAGQTVAEEVGYVPLPQ